MRTAVWGDLHFFALRHWVMGIYDSEQGLAQHEYIPTVQGCAIGDILHAILNENAIYGCQVADQPTRFSLLDAGVLGANISIGKDYIIVVATADSHREFIELVDSNCFATLIEFLDD